MPASPGQECRELGSGTQEGSAVSDKVRIGLVGCGDIAGAHLEGYQLQAESGCQHFEVVALCDPVEEARGRCAEKLRSFQAGEPEQFGALDDLIAAGIVDGVDVCTPHGDHHTTAVACLDAGVHVLVEKPLGITIKAAKQIEAAAKRTGKILSVAENARRGLGPRAMAWLFNENRMIGAPRMFVSERIEGRKLPSNQTGEAGEAMADEEPLEELNWRNLYRLCGGGWTFDGGVHMMDALQVYFGGCRVGIRRSAQDRTGVHTVEGRQPSGARGRRHMHGHHSLQEWSIWKLDLVHRHARGR